jgi:hypothetical protein
MTKKKELKQRVRARQEKTGESYTAALAHVRTPPPIDTIGHWKNGTMDHEWLFWDNQDFMNQLGLGK